MNDNCHRGEKTSCHNRALLLLLLCMSRIWIKAACFLAVVVFSANSFANGLGTISGHVFHRSSVDCIPHAKVLLYDFSGAIIDSSLTDDSGHFDFDVAAGNYYLSAESENLVKKYYPNEYLFRDADNISIRGGQSINIPFVLETGGGITGDFNCQGRDANHGLITALKIDDPAAGLYKSISLNGPFPSSFVITGLLPGTYKILGRARGNGTEYYPGVDNFMDARPLTIVANSVLGSISFGLNPVGWGTIQGQVIDKTNGNNLTGIVINAYQWQDFWQDPNLMTATTHDDGTFSLHVPAGEYFVFASYLDQNNPGDYKALYYDNRFNAIDANAVVVRPDSNVDGINFAIDYSVRHDLSISGNVTDFNNNAGLSDIVVTAIDHTTGLGVASAYSSHNGDFSINNLASGQYILMFSGAYIIPSFFNNTENWQNGEVILLQDNSRYVTSEAITQDYGNFGLAIIGNVTSRNMPLEGARIYAYPVGEDDPVAYARSNSDGHYEIICGLIPGSYVVKCDMYGYWSDTYSSPVNLDLLNNPISDNVNFQMRSLRNDAITSRPNDDAVRLSSNYPNPFKAQTSIELFSAGDTPREINIVVYNLLGQKVGDKSITIMPGPNLIKWNLHNFTGDVPSGVYFYKVAGSTKSYRMTLLK